MPVKSEDEDGTEGDLIAKPHAHVRTLRCDAIR
jgi:hypothetical protein